MGSVYFLHIHATARPNERGQGLEVAKEEMCVDDEVMDGMTHSHGQSQLTSLDTLLSVSKGSGRAYPTPRECPTVFPHSGFESDRHDVEEEAAIRSMNDLRDDQVGYVLFYLSQPPYCPVWHQFGWCKVMTLSLSHHTITPSHVHPLPTCTSCSECP